MGGTWGPILLQVVSGWLSELSLPGRCGLSTRGWVRVWVPNANDRPLCQGGSLQPPFAHCPTVRSIKRGRHATGPQQPVWVDLSNGSTQGVPACHRAGAPPKACGRRSARFSSFDRCRCSVEVPALSCASPTRMPLRGQREGACGGAWLVFVLLRPGSKTAPSLRCSLAVAPIGAHLPSICCDPAGILPTLLVSRSSVFSWDSTRLFNAVTNQSIRRPTLAVGPPKNNSPTTLCYAFQLYLLERSRICDVPDPCAPGPQQGVGRPK